MLFFRFHGVYIGDIRDGSVHHSSLPRPLRTQPLDVILSPLLSCGKFRLPFVFSTKYGKTGDTLNTSRYLSRVFVPSMFRAQNAMYNNWLRCFLHRRSVELKRRCIWGGRQRRWRRVTSDSCSKEQRGRQRGDKESPGQPLTLNPLTADLLN